MSTFKIILIGTLVSLMVVSACERYDLLKVADDASANAPAVPAVELTPEVTFSKLRGAFRNPIFKDFSKLQSITQNRHYLAFLSQEYPAAKSFKSFDDFLETVKPQSERYLPFLKTFLKDPTDEDITMAHQIAQEYKSVNALQYEILNEQGDLLDVRLTRHHR